MVQGAVHGERAEKMRAGILAAAEALFAERGAGMLEQTRCLRQLVQREVLDRPNRKETKLAAVDPVHMASSVAGATVFFVTAMPAPPTPADAAAGYLWRIHAPHVLFRNMAPNV